MDIEPGLTDDTSIRGPWPAGNLLLSRDFSIPRQSRRRHRSALAALDLIPSHPRNVNHNRDVDQQDHPMKSAGPSYQVVELERQIDRTRDNGQPLRSEE